MILRIPSLKKKLELVKKKKKEKQDNLKKNVK